MSIPLIPNLPGDMIVKPIHIYSYELNLDGIRREISQNIENLNRYTEGSAAVSPLYMVFSRITNEKPSNELLAVMDFFLTHPKLDKIKSLNDYSTWFDTYGNKVSISPFGLFLIKTIEKQEWYGKQFVECLKSGADIRFQFGNYSLEKIRYRDYILSATTQLYTSLMIKILIAIKKVEQLTWTEENSDSSFLVSAVIQHNNSALYLLLEEKLFDVNSKPLLHYLVKSAKTEGYLDTYALLLRFGADVNYKSGEKTALEVFLSSYVNEELTDSNKNLIWNMCILSINSGYTDLNSLYQIVTQQIKLGPEYYLPIDEVFYDED